MALRSFVLLPVLALCALGAGCDFPRDPEGTLDRVRDGTLRVGVIEDPPWVRLGRGEPTGFEPGLVREFANRLGAEVEWVEGTESDLAEALRGFQLDLVIGGLTRDWPHGKEAALTRPYIDTNVELGVPAGESAPDELGGVEIWVRAHSEEAALLKQEEEDAVPRFFEDLDQVDGLALLPSYEIDVLGYERSGYILRDHEHAMAVPAGENAFLVELEKFLLECCENAAPALAEEASR